MSVFSSPTNSASIIAAAEAAAEAAAQVAAGPAVEAATAAVATRTVALEHRVEGIDQRAPRRGPLRANLRSLTVNTAGAPLEREHRTLGTQVYPTGFAEPITLTAIADAALAASIRRGPLRKQGRTVVIDETGGVVQSVGLDRRTYARGPDGSQSRVLTVADDEPPPPPEADLTPIYGDKLFLLPDRRQVFYPQMIFTNRLDAAEARVSFSSDAYVVTGGDAFEIDPARCGAAGALTIIQRNLVTDGRRRVPLAVQVATPAEQTPSILAIGDSITNRGMLDLINARLTGLGITPSWVGTIPTAAASSTNPGSSAGPLGEARESRAWADLVYSILDGEATPLPPGQEAAYLALTKGGRIPYNPFLRVAEAGADDPAIVRNGYVFDFGHYLTRFSITAPDVLLIGLGENDCQESVDPGPVVEDAVRLVVASARAAAPSMKIGLWVSGQAVSASGDNRWTTRKAGMLRAMVRTVRDIGDPLVSLVSSWAHQTPDADWATAGSTVDPDSGVETGTVTDYIHPLGAARAEIAETLAAYIACASGG